MENENDYFEVEKMVRESFWNIYRPGAYEHYIVHNLRKSSCFIANLAYVIEDNGKIIGHINYSKGHVKYESGDIDAVVLGPIAIHKEYQNLGLGSKLIKHTLNLAENENIPFIFVIGDENYYHKFGFESSSKYCLYLDGTDSNDECPFFMIKIFDACKLRNEKGIFYNPDVFDVNENDVDEFDRKFEYMQKKVLESQLKEV